MRSDDTTYGISADDISDVLAESSDDPYRAATEINAGISALIADLTTPICTQIVRVQALRTARMLVAEVEITADGPLPYMALADAISALERAMSSASAGHRRIIRAAQDAAERTEWEPYDFGFWLAVACAN